MKREGRMHGAYVRERKHSPWPVKASSKPTNHSKYTAKSNCCSTLPANKARDKGKGTLKDRAFSITNNHKMHEWRISGSSPTQKPYLNVDRSFALWDQYGDTDCHGDCENNPFEIEEEGGEICSSEIVLPIESVLRLRKRSKTKLRLDPGVLEAYPEGSGGESDESWSGVDFLDGEDSSEEGWADDWSLVEEAFS